MGEAKRRAAAQRLAPPVPDDIRTEIANTIRHVTVVTPQAGGMCLLRALTGFMFLRELGLDAGLVFGSMVYRALPEFYWQPWSSLAWNTETHPARHGGTPAIGETWYGPYSGPRPDISEITQPILPVAKIAYQQIESRARELRLAERVRKFK